MIEEKKTCFDRIGKETIGGKKGGGGLSKSKEINQFTAGRRILD